MASSRACPSPSAAALALLGALAGLPGQERPPRQSPRRPTSPPAQTGQEPAGVRPADLAALFQRLRTMRGLSASYTEEKHLSLLAVPLTSSGKLYYRTDRDGANGQLVRVVEKPEPSKLSVTAKELRISGDHGTEVIDLRQSDRVRLFVTSLMQVFRGEQEALQRHYEVRFAHVGERGARWRLDLTPKQAPLDKILRSLSLRGAGDAVTQIVLTEPSGDRTITRIRAADPRRVFTPEEQRQIFGLRPPAPRKSPK